MDTQQAGTIIEFLANFWNHYTDVGIMVVCGVAAMVLSMIVAVFIPSTLPRGQQKAVELLLCVGIAWLLSSLMWWALDPKDVVQVRVIVSLVGACVTSGLYPVAASWATKKFPSIGSGWGAVVGP